MSCLQRERERARVLDADGRQAGSRVAVHRAPDVEHAAVARVAVADDRDEDSVAAGARRLDHVVVGGEPCLVFVVLAD